MDAYVQARRGTLIAPCSKLMDAHKISLGTILILIATSFCLFYTVRWVFLVLLIGVGIGVLLIPVVDKSRKHAHLPTGVTAFLLLLGLIALAGGIGYSLYIILSDQLGQMLDSVPQAYYTVSNWLTHHTPVKPVGTAGLNISSALQSTLRTLVHGAEIGAKIGAGLFYLISVSLYVAVDPTRNQDSILTLFPAHLRPRISSLLHQCAQTLRQWFFSHLIVVVCVGLAYALGLWLLGNPYWALFGVLAAVFEFIPYIGPFLIAIGASAVFLTNGQPMHVVWTTALAFAIQEIEGHVILPIVMKERIDLPPVQLITLAFVMALWFGVLGVFVTPPLLAVLRTIYLATYVRRMNDSTMISSRNISSSAG